MNSVSRFRVFFLVGVTLLIISLIIWMIPSIFLGSINGQIGRLNLKGTLSDAEYEMLTDFQWSKIWWQIQQATMFNPLAIVLFAIGIVVVLYGVITKFGW